MPLSQVGYGDITPLTVMGKLIGTVVVFLSMVFLALPLTIIVSTFSKVRVFLFPVQVFVYSVLFGFEGSYAFFCTKLINYSLQKSRNMWAVEFNNDIWYTNSKGKAC